MTIHVRTTRFDRPELVRVPEAGILTLPRGLPGFESLTRFALVEDPRYRPLAWLQALDDAAVRFVVVPRSLITADRASLTATDRSLLGLDDDSTDSLDIEWLLIVTVGVGSGGATANLRAPIALNRRTGRGIQIILPDDRLPLRFPLGGPAAPAGPAPVRACSS
jgi:flagellar assembly factor FliW